MAEQTTMHARDSVHGSEAKCFVTIEGRRYNFMNLTEFESEDSMNIAEIPILGKRGMGHKPAGCNGTWSATAHYNQSIMRKLALRYRKTGALPYFEIQVTNDDPTSTIGRQTIIHYDCLCESTAVAKFAAGEEVLTEDLSGTYEDWDMPEEFNELPGM